MKIATVVGAILVALGVLAVLGSLLVDMLGGGNPGFGIRQIAGAIFGAIDVVLGLILLLAKRSS